MFDDNLMGLTGMEAPALDGGNAPVVRYQDLQRGHSPASAGAPALASQRSYAPEVIEAAEEISEIGYSPLDVPDYVAPYYGAAQGGYGVAFADVRSNVGGKFPVLGKGDSDKGSSYNGSPQGNQRYTGQVADLQTRLNNYFGVDLPVTGFFGDQTAAAVRQYLSDSIVGGGQDATFSKAGKVGPNEWAYLYDVLPDTTVKTTARANAESKDAATKGVRGTTGANARSGAAKGASSFLEAFNIGSGYKEDPKKKFQASNQSGNAIGDGTDWSKVALWGGVAVAGIVATVLIVRAVSSKE